jgi:hypothetical protein
MLWSCGKVAVIWYFPPVLVYFIKKNLATLMLRGACLSANKQFALIPFDKNAFQF